MLLVLASKLTFSTLSAAIWYRMDRKPRDTLQQINRSMNQFHFAQNDCGCFAVVIVLYHYTIKVKQEFCGKIQTTTNNI